jgi:hypothetical protein
VQDFPAIIKRYKYSTERWLEKIVLSTINRRLHGIGCSSSTVVRRLAERVANETKTLFLTGGNEDG